MAIRVSPRGTRGAGFPRPLMWLFKLFGGRQLRMYRRDGGQSLSRRMGFPVVLLATRGAKTGQPRTAATGASPMGPTPGSWSLRSAGRQTTRRGFSTWQSTRTTSGLRSARSGSRCAGRPWKDRSGPTRSPVLPRSLRATAPTSRRPIARSPSSAWSARREAAARLLASVSDVRLPNSARTAAGRSRSRRRRHCKTLGWMKPAEALDRYSRPRRINPVLSRPLEPAGSPTTQNSGNVISRQRWYQSF